MLWIHGEKALKKFLKILNSYHPTIKSTANYSREKISFSDVEIIKKGNQLVTDLYIKPTIFQYTNQYLHASSCHVFHSKKSILYSQALKLKRICSKNSFFDKRCNDLEIWLIYYKTHMKYEIRPENLNYRSKNKFYLISCKTCHKRYTGSSEELRARFNNYRCAPRNYRKNRKIKQESFHAHFADGAHSGEGN